MDYCGHYNTCSIYNCLSLVTALYIASYSEGRCLKPWHEFSQYLITYNYKADRRAHVCLGGNIISHVNLMSVTFRACSGITTHCFYFPPPVVIEVLCNVVFEFISFFFCYCLFVQKNHSPRATACNVEDTTDRKQGGPFKIAFFFFFK